MTGVLEDLPDPPTGYNKNSPLPPRSGDFASRPPENAVKALWSVETMSVESELGFHDAEPLTRTASTDTSFASPRSYSRCILPYSNPHQHMASRFKVA